MFKSAHRNTTWMIFTAMISVVPGLFLALEDSEIWGITSGKRLFDDIGSISSAHMKPAFSFLFGFIASVSENNWQAFMLSRLTAVILAAIGIFSLFQLVARMYVTAHERLASWVLLALAGSMPLFLVHFTRVRSDTIAASVCLLILALIMRGKAVLPTYILGASALLSITPKSIDLVFALAILTTVNSHNLNAHSKNVHSTIGRIINLIWLMAPIAVAVILSTVFGREPTISAFNYWLDSYKDSPLTETIQWSFLINAISSSWIPSGALILGVSISIFCLFASESSRRKLQLPGLSQTEKSLVVSGLVSLLFVLLHSQKFHFFLDSRLPFLVLLAAPGWTRLAGVIIQNSPNLRARLATLAVVMVSFSSTAYRINTEDIFFLATQRNVHREIEEYLERARPSSYWDAIGLFPKNNRVFHYPSPGDRTNAELIQHLEMSRPALILRTSKMNLLEPYLFIWLQQKYVRLNADVYIRATRLKIDPDTADCRISSKSVIDSARADGVREASLVLLVSTRLNPTWIQVPFIEAKGDKLKKVEHLDQTSDLILPNCHADGTTYAMAESQPWLTRPVEYNSTLFSYNSRL